MIRRSVTACALIVGLAACTTVSPVPSAPRASPSGAAVSPSAAATATSTPHETVAPVPHGWIAAFTIDGDWRGVSLIDPDDGTVLRFLAGDSYQTLAWSADGNLLAVGTESGLQIIDLAGDPILTLDGAFSPAWDPLGRRLAVVRADGLYLVDVETGAQETIGPHWAIRGTDWSPDGASIVFAASGTDDDPTGMSDHLYRVSLVDGQVEQLTKGIDGFPAISPDGVSVAFLRLSDTGYEAFLMSSSEPTDLRPIGQVSWGQSQVRRPWAPDGTHLLLLLTDGAVAMARLAGSVEKVIAAVHDGWAPQPAAWSGDGARILVSWLAMQGDAQTCEVFSVADSTSVELGLCYGPAWQPVTSP